MKIPLYDSLDRDPLRIALRRLSKKLAKTYRQEARRLSHSAETLAETQALHTMLRCVQEAKYALDQKLAGAERCTPQTAAIFLEEQKDRVQRVTQENGFAGYVRARDISIQAMNLLFLTESEIVKGFPIHRAPAPAAKPVAQAGVRVTITSEVLFQIHHHILPPEKMLVASGQRSDNTVRIGAVFEVTGDHGMGHVRADPTRLARALISMDLTNTHFALWLHSHPGCGKEATRPSTTDLKQHEDWLRHYSPILISAIMVQDRWIRFWGTALDTGTAKMEIIGPGITKEGANELYRLDQ